MSRLKAKCPRIEGSTSSGSRSPLSVGKCEESASGKRPASNKLSMVSDEANSVGKHFSPVLFYGSPHGVPPKRPSSLLRLLREIRVDLAEKHKSHIRKDVWATFPRQEEAIKFANQHTDVRIFSYQDHFNGTRRFLVSTYQEFWQRYKHMNPKFRHHYEIIEEGLPCHIYFDLEFSKRENADKNGDQMVDLLLSVTFQVLLDKYSLQGSLDWVIELDSSTQEKFSRHLVIRIPRAAFKDNSHVGAFVAEVCSRLRNLREKEVEFGQLFVSKDSADPCLQLFVDNAVYSRNRCFRLALSSKAGKTSMLLPTGRFRCKDMNEADMFMASLICNMDEDCEKLLICKMEVDCMKTLHFDTEMNCNYRKFSTACAPEVSGTCFMEKSPFPALDAFIISVASLGNVAGKIRCWYWFSQYGLMVYSMSRNRYCERIGREHKSNHVMYVVDLQWALYYQKCYDPDCRGYRSPSRPIPLDVIPEAFSSEHTGYNMELMGSEVTLAERDEDERMAGECSNEMWWREAIKVADTVESMGNLLDFGSMQEDASNEEKEWWGAVESIFTTS
ncbi:hypothetical protein Dimus_000213 [Dionaea muscipula]